MRIKAAILAALIAAPFIVFGLFGRDGTLEPRQLDHVRTACPECHGEVPAYRAAATVHVRHAAFDCGRCHGAVAAVKTAAGLHAALEVVFAGFLVLVLAGVIASLRSSRKRPGPGLAAEPRTVRRFRGPVIAVHWLHAGSFAALLVSGTLMFYDLTSMDGGRLVRSIHKACAAVFVAVPVGFSLIDPLAAGRFLRETFLWSGDDLDWLRSSAGFYFGRKTEMPRQAFLNGDQRLWQLNTAVTGAILALTGLLMWLFKLKISPGFYAGVLLAHALSFAVAATMFPIHLYLTLLHPGFGESLSSMVDGKISPTYAREHFAKWQENASGQERT